MVYIVWFLSVVASFGLGYLFQDLTKKIEAVQIAIKEKVDKKPEQDAPQSQLIDVLDPVQTAMYEHEKEMKRLNPDG